ncbi:hypothetical protein KKB06_00815 [Patescibacteria group bacterium]|nr:hypothetical protein [Patescibacteria group bacterium]
MTPESKNHLENLMNVDILSRIQLPNQNHPKLIIICGPCRTATGALATVLGRAEEVTDVHIQPLKAFGRKFIETHGKKSPTPLEFLKDSLEVKSGDHVEIIKETLGPDILSPAEFINPLKLLLQKGFPKENITLVPTNRNPLDTVTSWKTMWRYQSLDLFPFSGFNQSFQQTLAITQEAIKMGIKTIPFTLESLRDFGSLFTTQAIFKQANLTFHPSVINWGNENAYWTKTVKYDLPPTRWIKGVLGKNNGGRGEFVWKPIKSIFTNSEIVRINQAIQPSIQSNQILSQI